MMHKTDLPTKLLEHLLYLQETGVKTLPQSAARQIAPAKKRVMVAKPASYPVCPPAEKSPTVQGPPPVPKRVPRTGPDSMERIAGEIQECADAKTCTITQERLPLHIVPGQGRMQPDVMFIGEGPGAEEDKQGLAFVGRAGELLTKMIEAMGYSRDDVFIGNIVKCRPEGNRTPLPAEMEVCMPFLKRQIALIRPKLIVCMGATAIKGLVNEKTGINKVHGEWREFEGIPVMLTFHPAYLLRDPHKKKPAWEDLKKVMERLGKAN